VSERVSEHAAHAARLRIVLITASDPDRDG
jgi:hypothetical protein